jgi:hypothetical protein
MLVVVTAAVLAVTLVVGLVAVMVFLTEIRAFLRDTAAILDAVEERATRLAGRIERVQHSTHLAASTLSAGKG